MTSILLTAVGLILAATASVVILLHVPDMSAADRKLQTVEATYQPNLEDMNRLLAQ